MLYRAELTTEAVLDLNQRPIDYNVVFQAFAIEFFWLKLELATRDAMTEIALPLSYNAR